MTVAMTDYQELPLALNVNQMAQILGISKKLAYKIAKENNLALRVGEKRLVIPKSRLIDYITSS